MLIYNVTTKVDPSIHEAWVDWMKMVHIPAIMDTKCFIKFQFVKLLDLDETDGFTYATQYYCNQQADYLQYMDQYAAFLRQEAMNTWGSQFASFRSLMQVVH